MINFRLVLDGVCQPKLQSNTRATHENPGTKLPWLDFPQKNKFNIIVRVGPHISDIKLIRTDTIHLILAKRPRNV